MCRVSHLLKQLIVFCTKECPPPTPREMYQAQRWLTDPMYSAVMITRPEHIFIRDFVTYHHHQAGSDTIARIEYFFGEVL